MTPLYYRFRFTILVLFSVAMGVPVFAQSPAEQESTIRHSVLIAGGLTGIIDEEGRVVWKTKGGAKDATRMPNGHILITYKDRVVEFNSDKQIVWEYAKKESDSEFVSAWRVDTNLTLVVVLGDQPRLIEVNSAGTVTHSVPVAQRKYAGWLHLRQSRC